MARCGGWARRRAFDLDPIGREIAEHLAAELALFIRGLQDSYARERAQQRLGIARKGGPARTQSEIHQANVFKSSRSRHGVVLLLGLGPRGEAVLRVAASAMMLPIHRWPTVDQEPRMAALGRTSRFIAFPPTAAIGASSSFECIPANAWFPPLAEIQTQ